MRDPFPLARMSGVIALANTDRFYTLRDIASKVLPSLCTVLVDPEKDVRDEAFKTIKVFMQKLEKISEQPELALEMEKDVSSCTLDTKNETTWTSWAMTSLSNKMTGYKNKNQQPSVALNTQPLGPPPSLNVSTSDKSPQQSQQASPNANTTTKPKEETFKPAKTETKFESNESGWSVDNDNDWKDLDDDDQMEPLESIEPAKPSSYLSQSSKKSDNKTGQSNNDWSSGWTNSFDDDKNSQVNDDDLFGNPQPNKGSSAKLTKSNNNSQSQLAPASSYNWATNQNASGSFFNDQAKNEEDLFSSLVKDVKPMKKSPSSTGAKAQSNTDSFSGWSNDWNDVLESPKDPKKQDRQQRNLEKQSENEAKKSSKPLKLGQKKDPF